MRSNRRRRKRQNKMNQCKYDYAGGNVLHAILFHYVEDDEECLISSLLSAS